MVGGLVGYPKLSYKKRKYLFFAILIYQCLQLLFDIRIFVFEQQIKTGNNIIHTSSKLFEYLIGFILVQIIVQMLFFLNINL